MHPQAMQMQAPPHGQMAPPHGQMAPPSHLVHPGPAPSNMRLKLNAPRPTSAGQSTASGSPGPVPIQSASPRYETPKAFEVHLLTTRSRGAGATAAPTHNPPPYPVRPKPAETNNRAKRPEADEFPWNRDFNFDATRAMAAWDDNIYDPAMLEAMKAVQDRNREIIAKYDRDEREFPFMKDQLHDVLTPAVASRNKNKNADGNASEGDQKRKTRAKKPDGAGNPAGNADNASDKDYYSFVSQEDKQRALALGCNTPEEVVAIWDRQRDPALQLDSDFKLVAKWGKDLLMPKHVAMIKICWSPGKGGRTASLEQAVFTIKDHIYTWSQIKQRPILLEQAAVRILDFCPDKVNKEILLRISAEGGLSNTAIRNRLCENGCYVDKATITKRIGATMGQKQQQHPTRMGKNGVTVQDTDKVKGYAPGQNDYYTMNSQDYNNYMLYFGRKIPHREGLRMKREAKEASSDDAAEGPPRKRSKTGQMTMSPEVVVVDSDDPKEVDPDATESEGQEEVNDDDAVSIQSDTMLDAIED